MTVLDVLLEGFDDAAHPRGWHGRWIGKPGGKVLRVFHGSTHVGDVRPGESRTHTMIGVGKVVGEAGRTISTQDIATVVDRAAGSPQPSRRVVPAGGANELAGGIPMLGRPSAAHAGTVPSGFEGSPTEKQSEEFDRHVARLGDDAVKHELGLQHPRHGYADMVYKFDGLTPADAERVLGRLRARGGSGLSLPAAPSGAAPPATTSHDRIVAELGRQGFRPGARVLANGDHPAEVVSVSDRGVQVKFDDGSSMLLARGTPGFARTKVTATQPQAFDPVTGLGREGAAARARGARPVTTEMADTRDKLTNLPVGQAYGLHGPRGQIGQVQRTAEGWHVQGPTARHDKAHATAHAATLHATRLQRSASADAKSADVMKRNWDGRQEVARMNARQAQRAEDERQRAAQLAARAGQGSGPAVFSSGRAATPAQQKRLAAVIADINTNAWQDRPHMNRLISQSLRDSGHVMGMSPGWMGRLHTNHASQLIKDLERLAKHGPGEMARESARPAGGPVAEAGVGVLLEAFTPPETPAQSNAVAARQTAAAGGELRAWSASKHPRAGGGKFGYTTGGKRAKRSSSAAPRTLHEGASGALVRSVQRQLGVATDGRYGPNTKAAVVRFQQQHRLLVDGVVGRQTLAALRGQRPGAPGPIGVKQARLVKPRTPAPVRLAGGVVV